MAGVQDESRLEHSNSVPVKGIDYVEFYVGNASQAAHFYRTAFGFTPIAYAGPETGLRDRVTFIVEQGNIRFALTSPVSSNGEVAEHLLRHGDGVKDIAITVDDAVRAFEQTVECGAQPVMQPTVSEDQEGRVIKATVSAFGDTVHSFIQRQDYQGRFFPHYSSAKGSLPVSPTGLDEIDHVAISVEQGTLDRWVDYYCNVLGFRESKKEDVSTAYSAMNSGVVESETGKFTVVIVEPAPGKRKSPIDEYLSYYGGAGVHHIALSTGDIIHSVGTLRANGVDFTVTPDSYYDMLEQRVGSSPVNEIALRELDILVDRDEWGYLLQIFSRPVQSRPTFFFEIIQRMGANGFGSGNVKALFQAIERDQVMRGNT